MPPLDIRRYPDPVLRRKAQPIHRITPEIDKLVDDMVKTMYESPNTIGLAAPQVGHALQLIAVDVSSKEKKHGLLVLFNPVLIWGKDKKILREGCLSLPDYTGNVTRYTQVGVQALNRKWETVKIEADGIEAICLQHEIDHIEGLMFLDRVACLKTDIFRRKRYGNV